MNGMLVCPKALTVYAVVCPRVFYSTYLCMLVLCLFWGCYFVCTPYTVD